jgi:hypothetical protein
VDLLRDDGHVDGYSRVQSSMDGWNHTQKQEQKRGSCFMRRIAHKIDVLFSKTLMPFLLVINYFRTGDAFL